jgi:hypothetical protein
VTAATQGTRQRKSLQTELSSPGPDSSLRATLRSCSDIAWRLRPRITAWPRDHAPHLCVHLIDDGLGDPDFLDGAVTVTEPVASALLPGPVGRSDRAMSRWGSGRRHHTGDVKRVVQLELQAEALQRRTPPRVGVASPAALRCALRDAYR